MVAVLEADVDAFADTMVRRGTGQFHIQLEDDLERPQVLLVGRVDGDRAAAGDGQRDAGQLAGRGGNPRD